MDERAEMLAILGPAMERLKKFEADGRVSEPSEIQVADGIGFSWPVPGDYQIVVLCFGPITDGGGLIQVAVLHPSGELERVTPPPYFRDEIEVNPDCRYPAPRPRDNTDYLDHKILTLISRLVDDPLSR